jgi:hypothetical protein
MKKPFFLSVIFIVLYFASGYSTFAQASNKCTSSSAFDYDDEHTLTIDAGLLLQEPKCYDGVFVRTFGFYSYGFEMSSLSCPDCGNKKVAWVNMEKFHAAIKRCTSPENFKKLTSKNGATLGVVVLGVLNTRLDFDDQSSPTDIGAKRLSEMAGGFGHMNMYDNEFSPICFEQVEAFSTYSIATNEKTLRRMKQWHEKMSDKLW